MITAYIIGFFVIFVAYALYNNRCKVGDEIQMPQAFFASLFWPLALTIALIAIIWGTLERIFNLISKK